MRMPLQIRRHGRSLGDSLRCGLHQTGVVGGVNQLPDSCNLRVTPIKALEAFHAMVKEIDLPLRGNLLEGVGGDINHIKTDQNSKCQAQALLRRALWPGPPPGPHYFQVINVANLQITSPSQRDLRNLYSLLVFLQPLG